MPRESDKTYQKKLNESLKGIEEWIRDVEGKNREETIEFIIEHLPNLNNNSKRSLYENILDQTETRLNEPNKLNDLMKEIEELLKIKKSRIMI